MAKAQGAVLNESDVAILQEIINAYRRGGLLNTPSKSHYEQEELGAPDKYICLPQNPNGISGMDQPGTGTIQLNSGAGDIPGSGICDVYDIVNGALVDTGIDITVYNLTSSNISREWITASRTKFGKWIAEPKNRTVLAQAQGPADNGDRCSFIIMPGEGFTANSERVWANVRNGFIVSGGYYFLGPCAGSAEVGTAGTIYVQYEVLTATVGAWGLSAATIPRNSTGAVTVGGKDRQVKAKFGLIEIVSPVWVAYDPVFSELVGIQVPCPTSATTGT